MIPMRLSHCVNIVELRQPVEIRSPSEIIHNEALGSCGFRRINHGSLEMNTGRPDNADSGILPDQGLG